MTLIAGAAEEARKPMAYGTVVLLLVATAAALGTVEAALVLMLAAAAAPANPAPAPTIGAAALLLLPATAAPAFPAPALTCLEGLWTDLGLAGLPPFGMREVPQSMRQAEGPRRNTEELAFQRNSPRLVEIQGRWLSPVPVRR